MLNLISITRSVSELGSRSTTILSVAAFAALYSVGCPAKAEVPEFLMAPIPEYSQTDIDLNSLVDLNFDVDLNESFEEHIQNSNLTDKIYRKDIYNNGTVEEVVTENHPGNYTAGYTFSTEGLDEVDIDWINRQLQNGNRDGVIKITETSSNILNKLSTDIVYSIDCNINIENSGHIKEYTANFINNNGSFMIENKGNIDSITFNAINTGMFSIINTGTIKNGIINSNFINNHVNIPFEFSQSEIDETVELFGGNEDFFWNIVSLEVGMTLGILSNSDLNIEANNGKTSIYDIGTITFVINSEEGKYIRNMEGAITVTGDAPTLSLTAKEGGKLVINKQIKTLGTIDSQSKIKITGDETGIVYLNNKIESNTIIFPDSSTSIEDLFNFNSGVIDVSLDKTNLVLGRSADVLDGHNLTLNSGTLSMANGEIGISQLNRLNINGDTNFAADVDLEAKQMDRLNAKEYGEHTGNLHVIGMNLLSDAKQDKTEILFADSGMKNNVTTSVKELKALTPIYKYTVNYENRDDAGYFVFNRGASSSTGGGNASDGFNPAVLASSVAALAGASATVSHAFNYSFQNVDNFMNLPYFERLAIKNANKYAISDTQIFSPIYEKADSSSVWVKPYASFENLPLKNGPKVSSISYGTLIGFDTQLKELKNGWDRVWTGYIGYNGASLRYSGVDSTQNGGLLGGTVTFYKGNFFNATTLSTGASVASNQTMYGHEDLTMLLGGIGNKIGCNFEFKEGKIILQPSMLMSYTFVNTFDYTNAAGVRIKSDPLHSIQLSPGVKLIGNTKNGWQPYASVNMVWNLLDKSKVTAEDVRLPEISVKPYIQYGVGVQKKFKDNCMAFGQAMIQNGGRNGISLNAGLRWALGKEGAPIKVDNGKSLRSAQNDNKTLKQVQGDKTNTLTQRAGVREPQPSISPKLNIMSQQDILARSNGNTNTVGTKKIVKQLTPTQKTALGAKPQNTTRTTAYAVIKPL